MRTLALDTSTSTGTVAVLESGVLLGQRELPRGQRSAQALAPLISEQLVEVGWKPREIELIATTRGPGSFTGLRIGVTTAKTLAYATGAQLLAVNTLEVIAAQAPTHVQTLEVVLDAQRQQLYRARYRRDDSGRLATVTQTSIVDASWWISSLESQSYVTGPGLSKLADRLPDGVRRVEPELWAPRAKTVGQLAFDYFRAGRRDDLWQLVPSYFRKSAAEETKDSQQQRE